MPIKCRRLYPKPSDVLHPGRGGVAVMFVCYRARCSEELSGKGKEPEMFGLMRQLRRLTRVSVQLLNCAQQAVIKLA